MRRPGDRLRRAAARWCSDKTLRQRVDPLLADLQCEHRQALQQGRRWRAGWIRIAAYAALLKVLAVTTTEAAVSSCLRERPRSSEGAAMRHGLVAALATTALTVVLVNTPFFALVTGDDDSSRGTMLLYLVPHALVLAVPIAALIAVAVVRPALSRAQQAGVLAVAAACSIGALFNVGWITPAANQAFRIEVAGDPRIPRGDREMTILESRAALMHGAGDAGMTARQAVTYYSRWALAFAPLVLTLFALSIRIMAAGRRVLLALFVSAMFLAYYLPNPAALPAALGWMPAVLIAWLPNVVFGVVAGRNYLWRTRVRRA